MYRQAPNSFPVVLFRICHFCVGGKGIGWQKMRVGRELGSAPHADHAQPCARAGDAAWMHAGMHAAVIDSKQQACALLFAHPQHACACTTRDREGARCVHPPIVPMLERAIKARRWCTAGRAGLPVVQSPFRGFRAALRPPSTWQHWPCTSPSGPWELVSFWETAGGK